MPELPRNLRHLFVDDWAESEPYTSRSGGRNQAPPVRERVVHAEMLLRAINGALGQVQAGLHADEIRDERDPRGFLLEFRMPLGAERFVQKLEDRRKHIELLSVSDRGADGLSAAVYVPMQSREYFLRKIEKYRDEETRKGRPKNESLVARVDRIVSGAFDSVFTDELDSLPEVTQSIWWEVWLSL